MTKNNKANKFASPCACPDDERWMRLALEWAKRGEGKTRPNPPVGAVVAKNGRLLATGYHRKAGTEHAERMALRKAGSAAAGATLYVTLEPCSTYGRTPPCTDCILESGVKRVVIAVSDPNPKHNRRGINLLRRSGIDVQTGICRKEADELLAPFKNHILHRKPLVSLKMALTADGKIADNQGASRWITGTASRKSVQELRRTVDAVMVGIGTVEADDPSLLPRPANGRKPWRVILDSHARIRMTSRVLQDEHAAYTLVAVTPAASPDKIQSINQTGAQVLLCKSEKGHVDPEDLLRQLGERGLMHVLCEGGGRLAATLVEHSLVDRLYLFIAPSFLGASGIPLLTGNRNWSMSDKPSFHWSEVQRLGEDILLISKRK